MRIAQVSPLWERVPPPGYGGIELVVAHLTDELVRRGHDVTLFASGDSITKAKLEAVAPVALRLNSTVKEPAVYEMMQLGRVLEKADRFDIIHFHTGFSALPFAEALKTPTVHTLHGTFTPDNRQLFTQYAHQAYISISNAQQQLEPELNYICTVHNGIAPQDYPFYRAPQDPPYLAFLGRMSPEKGPNRAIAIAKATGLPLKMAGKIDVVDREFFEQAVAPHIDGDRIEYLGELSHEQKVALLGRAAVTLFPIDWNEPFGLVTIESMSTGTPVVAMNLGAVPEVIDPGKTGFICSNLDEAIAAVPQAMKLSRQSCHDRVANHFSVSHMVDRYEAAYHQIIDRAMSRNGHTRKPQLIPLVS